MAEIKINFTPAETPAVAQWNNATINSTFNNLLDSADTETTVNVATSNWDSDNYNVQKPNTLGYPADVWDEGFSVTPYDGHGTVTITGLKATTLYTFYFSGSTSNAGREYTIYTLIGNTTGSPINFDPSQNTSNEVTTTMTSDGSGTITLDVDSSPSAYGYLNYLRIVGDFDLTTSVTDVNSGNPIASNATGVPVNFGAGGNGTTQIKLKFGALEVIQSNLTIVNDNQVTFDVVPGELPYGTLDCVITVSGTDYTEQITFTPVSGNEYVNVLDPIYDNPAFKSVLDSAPGPTPVDGDQLEIQDPTNEILLYPSGVYEVDAGGPETFQVRRRSITTGTWGDWVVITVDTILVLTPLSVSFTGIAFSNTYSAYVPNQPPVVTPPADLSIEFAFASGGLSKSNSTLTAWLASATVSDDNDEGLTASGDISALSDPIVVGSYPITFSATDNGGLTGTATANLIVSEAAAPNQAPVVIAPQDTTIEYTENLTGLPKSNSALVSWISSATVSDDNDTVTVSADLSALADPIPSGVYQIVFTSSADSEGLTGSDVAYLTVRSASKYSEIITPGTVATSYATLAEADAYHIGRLHNDAWLNETPYNKRSALVWATRILDTLHWKGKKADSNNLLHWPATGVYDRYGSLIDSAIIPVVVKNACCELAFHLVSTDTTVEKGDSSFKKLSVGGLDMEFKGNESVAAKIEPIPQGVKNMIRHLLRNSAGGVIV